jgi:hypothetical protein
MADASVQDLFALDRDVALGVAAVEGWRDRLRRNPETAADDAPLEPVRRVTARSTWAALGDASPSVVDVPLRDALRQWVVALTQARVGGPAEVARARAESEPRGRLEGEKAREVSWREAWRGVVSASGPSEARLYLEAAATAAAGVAEAAGAGATRSLEVARRFGMEHPWEGLVGAEVASLRHAAKGLLDATEMISGEVWRAAWRAPGATAAGTMHEAVGREAGEGWPARLTYRWLQEALVPAAAQGMIGNVPALPAPLGAASFARALGAFGRGFRLERAARMPFALAREPASVAAHRFAFVFAALPTDPEWQSRALGVGRRVAMAQVRVLARAALLDARLHAARILLGDPAAFAAVDTFDELGLRLFGSPLDARLRGAWPAARGDEPGRFVGLLQAHGMNTALRERFDIDWFRNPRAWDHLRGLAEAPAREPTEAQAFGGQVAALARAFEETLG